MKIQYMHFAYNPSSIYQEFDNKNIKTDHRTALKAPNFINNLAKDPETKHKFKFYPP